MVKKIINICAAFLIIIFLVWATLNRINQYHDKLLNIEFGYNSMKIVDCIVTKSEITDNLEYGDTLYRFSLKIENNGSHEALFTPYLLTYLTEEEAAVPLYRFRLEGNYIVGDDDIGSTIIPAGMTANITFVAEGIKKDIPESIILDLSYDDFKYETFKVKMP